jgi:anti-sigma factor RsiW
MKCRQARRLLPQYLENSLTSRDSSAMRDHLASCPNCSSEERQLRAALDFVRLVKSPSVPHSLRKSVLRQIENEGMAQNRPWLTMEYSSSAAAAAVFVLLLAGNVLLSAWSALRLSSDVPAPVPREAQVRPMLQEEAKKQMDQSVLEAADTAPKDTTARQAEDVQLTVESVENAGAKQEIPQGRLSVIWRLLLNITLVPLLIFFMWRAVKKGRVA